MRSIKVNNVSKHFKLYAKRNHLLRFIIDFFKEEKKDFQVLKDVSFSAEPGEILGIIGHNGSGKSTLLRVIAGVYSYESGSIETDGHIFILSGLDNGLKSMLTARENIFLVGTILGLGKKEIEEKYDEILDFAGLREFENVMLLKFSSGMKSRLAFSITINCVSAQKPEILLLDEVFAGGGDEEFKQRSLQKIEDLIHSNSTVIMVSHSLPIVRQYCDKVLWLEKGQVVEFGRPDDIVDDYLKSIKK